MIYKYKIFVITHNKIFENIYNNIDDSNLIFINISNKKLEESLYKKYDILDIKNMPNFISIGNYYTESEVIYNIYKNKLYNGLSHVGFSHYDVGFKCMKTDMTVIDTINKNIKCVYHLNTSPFDFLFDYNQNILADDRQPNMLVGSGKNCYAFIIDEYNNFYNTSYGVDDIKPVVNLCSCFFIDVGRFENMMIWISNIIERGILNQFDTNRLYRIQGGLLERFYAVWLSLNVNETDILYCEHKKDW